MSTSRTYLQPFLKIDQEQLVRNFQKETYLTRLKNHRIFFIFLGYDQENDVFVCWDFNVAKERLNVGKSVSFIHVFIPRGGRGRRISSYQFKKWR